MSAKKQTFEQEIARLEEIVAADQKQRYAFDERRTKIRANQGHSIAAQSIS